MAYYIKNKINKNLLVLIFICNHLSFSQSIWYYCIIFNESLVASLCSYYFLLFKNFSLSFSLVYDILSHICDEFNFFISYILIRNNFCQYWFIKKKGTITIIYRWHGPHNFHANVWKNGKTFARNVRTTSPYNIHANVWKDGQTFIRNLRTTTNIILPYSQLQ